MFSRRSADLNLNFLLDFHQAAVDSVGKTDLPPLKHPGKVYYFHQKECEDHYQIFKLDGQCLETQEDLLQKYWAIWRWPGGGRLNSVTRCYNLKLPNFPYKLPKI